MKTKLARKYRQEFDHLNLEHKRWTHEMHFIIALDYLLEFSKTKTIEILSKKIPLYNEKNNVKNTESQGYHHTLTIFYI